DLPVAPGVVKWFQEEEGRAPGNPEEDGVDVTGELADVGGLVGRAERRPQLLDDLAAGVLERLVEARHDFVPEGEVVGDRGDLLVAERLRRICPERLRRLTRRRRRAHEEWRRLALGQVVGGRARRDRRGLLR